MKVGVIGFGKTGKAVTNALISSGQVDLQWVVRRSKHLEHRSVSEFFDVDSCDAGLIYSSDEYSAAELLDKYPVDAIVDFSSESGMDYYAQEAASRGLIIVSAISKYSNEAQEKLKSFSSKTVVLHSPNITVGINFLIVASKILKNIAPYTDIEIIEEHFKQKPEVSGTARVIAEKLDVNDTDIKSLRAGGIVGVHEVLFGFPYQTVRLRHESIAREAFGDGVLFALKNLEDKPIGFYTMEDLLIPYFKLNDASEALDEPSKRAWWKFWL